VFSFANCRDCLTSAGIQAFPAFLVDLGILYSFPGEFGSFSSWLYFFFAFRLVVFFDVLGFLVRLVGACLFGCFICTSSEIKAK
jgi:hypothetical protein